MEYTKAKGDSRNDLREGLFHKVIAFNKNKGKTGCVTLHLQTVDNLSDDTHYRNALCTITDGWLLTENTLVWLITVEATLSPFMVLVTGRTTNSTIELGLEDVSSHKVKLASIAGRG